MIIRSDARHIPLTDESVDCCVTSPPYWGLRCYGLPLQAWSGDADCVHAWGPMKEQHDERETASSSKSRSTDRFYGEQSRRFNGNHQKHSVACWCVLCGAWKGSFGLEPTIRMYVEHSVEVFREVRRVLRPEGTLWLNLGDSYATNRGSNGGSRVNEGVKQKTNRGHLRSWMPLPSGLKDKDLCGVPWRVALALQDDGWWLRSDVIWSKPNPMPESVMDRPTRSHEYLFLLSKNKTYYYDAQAIAETADVANFRDCPVARRNPPPGCQTDSGFLNGRHYTTRNKRSVWEIPLQPFNGAHFATFPEKLVEPCIAAGCPEGGLVLDPFAGSGTVGEVAYKMGRRFVLCDLKYQQLQRERIPPMEFTYALAGVPS